MNGTATIGRKRFVAGFALIGFAVLLPIAALLFPVFGLPSPSSNLLVALLVAGAPEMLCLAAIALLGQEGFPNFGDRFRAVSTGAGVAPVASKMRYYGGLVYCLLNTLPISLYAYAPHWMPGEPAKYLILAVTDLGFILSVFLMGGEFWEKFRRLFIWEGRA